MSTQTDISEILGDIQASEPILNSHRERINTIMRHFAEKKIPLSTCADERHLNRSISTLQAYARELKLRFPDYVPWEMRTAEEKKRKRRAA